MHSRLSNQVLKGREDGTEKGGVYLRDLYAEYSRWCDASGIRNKTTRGRLKSALEDLAYTVERDSSSKVVGIRLKSPEELPDIPF